MKFRSKNRIIYPTIFGLAFLVLIWGINPNIVSSKSEAKNKLNKNESVKNAPEAEFSNPNPIVIPDAGPANPYPSTITVSGLSGNISNNPGSVKVTLNNFSHTYTQDVAMLLVGPTGAAYLLQDGAGDSAISNVTYTLSDTGSNFLPDEGVWTTGTYRATAYFEGSSFPPPAPGTDYQSPPGAGEATFSSVFGNTDPNGSWNLYVADFVDGDAGNISGGWTLDITTGGGTSGTRRNVSADFDGDRKTDFSVVSNSPSSSTSEAESRSGRSLENLLQNRSPISVAGTDIPTPENHGTSLTWYINNSSNNTFRTVGHGRSTSTDFTIPEDFDGDGKDDVAVWRPESVGQPSGNAFFYILQSTDNTVVSVDLGQALDTPIVTGDYDGDGKSDPAVFRCPQSGNGQCFYYYRASLNNPNNNITYVPFGNGTRTTQGSNIYVNPGDFDGDGKYDFCIQRTNPSQAGQGQYVLLRSSDSGVEYINFGLNTDFIVPGDYDGDGKSDFMNLRVNANNDVIWYLQTRTGATSQTQWGKTGLTGFDEFITQGDYDGDGSTDLAVWRRDNTNPDNSYFYVRRSSNQSLQTYEFGAPNFFPVPGWNVN